MTRQIGVALGVACLVAILGAASGASAVPAYHHAWIFMMGCSLLAGLVLQGIGTRVTETADAVPLVEAPATGPAAAPDAAAYALTAGR
jgi:hypothetical protein